MDRWDVGFWEVSVIVSVFLRPLAHGAFLAVHPSASLLDDTLASCDGCGLSAGLILNGLSYGAYAVHVLDLYLFAELVGPDWPDADVRIASEGTLFHAGRPDTQVLDD